MKNTNYKMRIGITLAVIASSYLFSLTAAWAAMPFMKTDSGAAQIESQSVSQIPQVVSEKNKSRAPEPSTIALFGSGIFGMVIAFVRRAYVALKRMFDIASSVIGIILLSPLFLAAAILIKLTSKGPIIYKQVRVGKDGENFEMYKFRTMRVDAEKGTGPVWAKANDDRLIPIGNILRKAHIDEIPQFFNILKGDMSLIGPRPERPIFVERFTKEIPDYKRRLEVKPGLTGLAQVWHKYDESIEDVRKKIKYDLLYIKKFCLWTDVRILLRTVRVVFTGEGAR